MEEGVTWDAMWRVEDHTADVLLFVEAPTWPALLEEAAVAFAGYVCAGAPPPARPVRGDGMRAVRRVEVKGGEEADTWVQWWRALHRLWTVEELLPVEAGVKEDASPKAALGTVRCAPASVVRPEVDVKAVTWHGAEVYRDHEGDWVGKIVLDV